MKFQHLLISLLIGSSFNACAQQSANTFPHESDTPYSVVKTEEEWKSELSQQEFYVLRQKGTERPFTGDLLENKEKGVYICRACAHPLFKSETKFESGTGWPSFYAAIEGEVEVEKDASLGVVRSEILCSHCGGHLGHVFDDGPAPTGLRYCVNSASLDFKAE